MGPANTHLGVAGVAPSGPLQVQAGVQHGHQHTLTCEALLPGSVQAHQVIAVAVGAFFGEDAGLINGTVIHMLHIGVLHPIHGLDFSQLAIGDFHGHSVDQIGPLGDQLHILAHGRQQIALCLLQLGLPGLGRTAGQILADGFAGRDAGDGGSFKASQDRLFRQGDDDSHQILGLVTRGRLTVGIQLLRLLFQPGYAGEFRRF